MKNRRKLLALAAAVAATLVSAVAAQAATIDDLRAAGYTVGIAGDYPAGCTTYNVSAPWGISVYVSLCADPAVQAAVSPDAQATLDSLANPVGLCNAKWQSAHPDEFNALVAIGAKGYAVSGDQCADRYTVSDGTGVVYSGAGAGLPALAKALGPAVAAPVPPGQEGGPPPPAGGGFCLPLCPNPGDQRAGAGVLLPATVTVTVGSTSVSFVYDTVTGELRDQHLFVSPGDAVAV